VQSERCFAAHAPDARGCARAQVSFDLAGGEESATPDASKGVNALLNMDTFSVLRQLRQKMQVWAPPGAWTRCFAPVKLHRMRGRDQQKREAHRRPLLAAAGVAWRGV
jgi:hypothetical protein